MKNLDDLLKEHSNIEINITEQSVKFLKSISQKEREQIYKKISHSLSDIDGLVKLRHDLKDFYKIKSGITRIILQKKQKNVINIYLIGRRDNVYDLLKRSQK